jgi:crotonobetainyl-CoA:carnitine CoA-transferase CaiB-like acyl-CoA transferase
MQAAGGIMSLTGEPGREAVRAGPSIVDQGTGMWAAIGVLAALRAREAGAGPQLVDTSLYETAVNWVPYQLVGYLGSGNVPRALGSSIGILAPYRAYPTRDGQVMIAAANDRLFARLCDAIAAPQLAFDLRFGTNAERVMRRDELDDEISLRTMHERTATWVARLREAGIPVAPIEDMRGVAESEQTAALGLLQHLPSETIPDLQVVAPPLSVAGDRLAFASPPPRLGQHTRELLQECGLARDEIDALFGAGAVSGER